MNQPLSVRISVIVPVYNASDTIASCIESIQRQTMADFQLVVVDDGSSDNSGAICDSYAARDSRITVVHQQNLGRTAARQRGTAAAVGEWLAYVDADDTLPEDALATLLQRADDGTDIVLGNGHLLQGESRSVIPMSDFRHLTIRSEGTIGVPWGSLYRRTVVDDSLFDIPREIYNGEDYLFWVRLVFLTEKPVHVVRQPVYNKGAEHTCADFVWTADYCQKLNLYRVGSIPAGLYDSYADDVITDQLVNLFAVAVCQRRQEWVCSDFYQNLMKEIRDRGYSLNWKKILFLRLPSLRMRRWLVR